MNPRLILLLFVVVLEGCGPTNLTVIYRSDPEGAYFLDKTGQQAGQSPMTMNYELSTEHMQNCEAVVPSYTARWVSGAVGSMESVKLNVCQGIEWTVTSHRPPDAPKYELDLWYAVELAKLEQQKAQTKMLRDAQWLQTMGFINQMNQQNQLNQLQQQQQNLQQQQQWQQLQIQQQYYQSR